MSLDPESRAALERLQTKWAREQHNMVAVAGAITRHEQMEIDRKAGHPWPTLWQKVLSYLKSYWKLVRG